MWCLIERARYQRTWSDKPRAMSGRERSFSSSFFGLLQAWISWTLWEIDLDHFF
jgi:hypothetical protein